MSRRVGIRELRVNLSQTIRDVERGDIVEVTRDGQPVARIVPIEPASRLDELIARRRARPALHPLDLDRPLPRAAGPVTASEALQEDRGE
jgi:prevent-host-death family protein